MQLTIAPDRIREHVDVLSRSTEPAELTASAIALASSRDKEALISLGRALRDSTFLGKLDRTDDARHRVSHLRQVFFALERNPTEITGRLCEVLSSQPGFSSVPERKPLLLSALAAVRPMTETAAGIFFTANMQGYAAMSGPLLVANGSTNALALFEEMVADRTEPPEDRVDMLHRSVLGRRVDAAVVEMCTRLLDRKLEDPVEMGLIESLFDYREKDWFGVSCFASVPPSWEHAGNGLLRFYTQLGQYLLSARKLPDQVAGAIRGSLCEISALLAERGAA